MFARPKAQQSLRGGTREEKEEERETREEETEQGKAVEHGVKQRQESQQRRQ